MQNLPTKTIFGKINETSIWACEWGGGADFESGFPKLRPGQAVFALVLSGEVDLAFDEMRVQVSAGQIGLIGTGQVGVGMCCDREAELLVIGMEAEMLAGMLDSFRPGIRSEIREMLEVSRREVCESLPMPDLLIDRTIPAFREPPVSGPALSFWFESQIRELIALMCFPPSVKDGEFFCSRQRRLALDRVAKAKKILQSRLEDSIDLQSLAAEIGCSPYYLSRTFSATTGMTISRYVRKLRIEAAAELLLSGRFNVSEVAIEVGYQSLSHFSKAFQQVKGCLPSKYEAA